MLSFFGLVDLLHLVHPAVTRDAADAAGNVGTMVEIDIIGQVVDALPMDGLPVALSRTAAACAQSVADRRVAVHADGRRRNGGIGGPLDRVVAIAAIDAHLAGVQLMGIGHGLTGRVADGGRSRRSSGIKEENQINRSAYQQGAGIRPGPIYPPLGMEVLLLSRYARPRYRNLSIIYTVCSVQLNRLYDNQPIHAAHQGRSVFVS